MNSWHFTPVSVIYFLSLGISLLIAILTLKIKAVKGARLFAIMMFFVSCWILVTTLGLFSFDEKWKLLMLKFEYLGMAGAVYFWVIFFAIYTQYDKWLKWYIYILLAIIPVLTMYFIIQAPEGTYIRTSFNFIEVKGLKTLDKNFGGMFFIWTAYAYLMMMIGFVLIIVRIIQTPRSNRKQLYYIVPVIFLIIIPNLFFISDNNPIEPYDPTPLAMVFIGILFLLTMYFHDFLSVGPMAQQLIFNNMKGCVIVVDNIGKVIDINKTAENIIAKNKKQVIGRNLTELLPDLSTILKQGNIKEDFQSEITLSEEKRVYDLKIASLFDKSNHIRGYILMFWDITDQKIALIELDAYARTVAHDLKSPLNHIMGCAQMLKEPDLSNKDKKEYLEGIISGGEKMTSIIDGLLMLAKIRNQDIIEKTEINMKKVLQSVIKRMDEDINRENVSVSLPNYWNKAIGNTLWIEEIWINLFSNAVKYGGNPPVIKLGSEKINGKVKFWISDNGNGLTEFEQKQLFTEFKRIHPDKEKIKGHGLGLSIVQRIITKMGGKVGVESQKGKGCTFFFTLPSA